jgi:hypothetical protein
MRLCTQHLGSLWGGFCTGMEDMWRTCALSCYRCSAESESECLNDSVNLNQASLQGGCEPLSDEESCWPASRC